MLVDADPLASAAHRRSKSLAVIDRYAGERLAYRSLDRRVDRIAGGLNDRGVSTGNRVCLVGSHGVDAVALVHAVWRLGGSVVPIDPELPDERLDERIDRVDPALTIRTNSRAGASRGIELSDLPTRNSDGTRGIGGRASEACVIFTSGTTGEARAVRLSFGNLFASAAGSASRLGVDPTDRWLVPLAPYHMGGFAPIVRAAVAGIGLVLAPFDSDDLSDLITDERVSVASVVPTMLSRDLDADTAFGMLRALLVGGDRVSPDLVRCALAADVPIYASYGMTEAASQVATATPAQLQADPTTVGRPLRGTRVAIDNGIGEGVGGEIVVIGPTVSPGYVDSEDDDRFPAPGTLRTGDAGVVDDDGLLSVIGRIDERIVTGGATIDPIQVTEILRAHPRIRDACVVGTPDEEWGQRVSALLVGKPVPATELEEFLRSRLSNAERPRRIEWTGELPRTASGTVDRAAVRARFRDGTRTTDQ